MTATRRGETTSNHHRQAGLLQGVILAGVAAGLLFTLSGAGEVRAQDVENVTLSAAAGFDGYCRKDEWVPIKVSLTNTGADIEGRVQVSYREKVIYGSDLLLPSSSNKRLFLYIYDQGFTRTLAVRLISEDRTLAKAELDLSCMSDDNRLVGLLVDNPSTFSTLTEIPLRGRSVRLAHLNPFDLPDQAQGWAGLDVLVVSAVDTGVLTGDQRQAMQNWLAAGGKLLVVGGPKWQGATAGLDGILPVEVNGTKTGMELTALQAYSDIPLPVGPPAILATGQLNSHARVLVEQDGVPLIASRSVGLGTVFLLAPDPGLKPLSGWSGMLDVYTQLLELGIPSVIWDDGSWESQSANAALATLVELGLPSSLYICGWLGLYVIVVGPAHYVVLRRLKRRELAWLTIPALVLLFTGVAYLSGFVYRGRQPILNRLAVIQAWEGSETAKVNALVGLYSPKRTKYTLKAEDAFKFYPFEGDFAGMSGTWRSLQSGPHTLLSDVQVEIGGVQAVALEGYLPALTFKHDLVLALSPKSPTLTGRITNTGTITLKDAVLVTSVGVQELGDLSAATPQEVDVRFVTGSAGSPFSVLDYNDIQSRYYTYTTDLTARRREALLNATLDYDDMASWGVYLMGWIEDPILPVTLHETGYKAVDTTFYIARLSPSIISEGDSLYLPPSLFSWATENESENNTAGYGSPYYTGVYSFPVGGYSTYFRPAVPLRFRSVQSLTLNIQASATPDKFTVSLWDYEEEEWSPIENLKWGSYDIPRPWRYVGPGGEIGLNIDSDITDEWVEIEPSIFTLVVRP